MIKAPGNRRAWMVLLICFLGGNGLMAQYLELSTSSDSARHLYREGWREILDDGDYTMSEVLYRRMVEFDSSFLVGWGLVGRISKDPKEQQAILMLINANKASITGDERRLLDINVELLKLTNARSRNDTANLKEKRAEAFQSIRTNFKVIVDKYPSEVHHLAEYIEVINYLEGPRAALKIIEGISPENRMNPFILGFAAELYSRLGNKKRAFALAAKLETLVPVDVPKAWLTWAHLYDDQGQYSEALFLVKRALQYDNGNLDAQRLHAVLLTRQ